jgi:hypothetical protein
VVGAVVTPAAELEEEDRVTEDMTMVTTVLNCDELVGLTAVKVSVTGDTMLAVVGLAAVKVSVTGDTMLAVVGSIGCDVVLVTSGNPREVDVEDVALGLKVFPEADI